MTSTVYVKWQCHVYCGATPACASSRLDASGRCLLPAEQWPGLLRTSMDLIDRLGSQRQEFAHLVRAKPIDTSAADPLSAWLSALWTHFGLPDRQYQLTNREDGSIRFVSTCPYPKAAYGVLVLASRFLNLAGNLMFWERCPLEVGPLAQLIRQLTRLVPAPSISSIHSALSEQGVAWEWLGGELTRVGQGRRQRLCRGFNSLDGSDAGTAAGQDNATTQDLLHSAGLRALNPNAPPRGEFDLLVVAGQLSAAAARRPHNGEPERITVTSIDDIPQSIHPRLLAACKRAFRLYPMPVLLLRYHANSLADDPDAAGGAFSAVHHSADLRSFAADPTGHQRLVSTVVATVFPADELRVPIYTVTGSVGKTTTTRLLGQLLEPSGLTIGMTTSDGAWIGKRRWLTGDCIGGFSAQKVLRHADVDLAVLELGRGGLVKQGIPFAHSDVAVLLNIHKVHLGLDGIDTCEAMADTKAITLRPAKLAVLNADDDQCQRLGAQRKPKSCVWFSLNASVKTLRNLSQTAHGAVGVKRDLEGAPLALDIWQGGNRARQLSLSGVAPFHGMLGEQTVEELLAAVAAAWFGPTTIKGWEPALQALELNNENHLFRCSVHRQGNIVFVLDKGGSAAALSKLEFALQEIIRRERIQRRIGILSSSALYPPDFHREYAHGLFRSLDEFVCFDRPDTYKHEAAFPGYAPMSVPLLMQRELQLLNDKHNCAKPILVLDDWNAASTYLRANLNLDDPKTLVLIIQVTTAATELNQQIADFAASGWPTSG